MSIVVEYEGRWDDMDWDEKKSYERYQELEKLRLQVEQTKAATELATVSPGEEIARIEMTEKKEIEIRRIEMMEKTMPWKTVRSISLWAGFVVLGYAAIQAFAG